VIRGARDRRRRTAGRLLLLAAAAAVAGSAAAGEMPIFPVHAPLHRYGTVVLERASRAAGMAPVAFEHWRHRGLYTCRLCHVDVGFAMQAGATEISAEGNRSGLHCGACHDGRRLHLGKPIFAACSTDAARPPPEACGRCHGAHLRPGWPERAEAFARTMPRDGADLIDWLEAERRAFSPPTDQVEGISLAADRLRVDRNFSIGTLGTWLGEVAFDHSKHARWSGCEGCHPEIFPSTRRGASRWRMKDIVAGEACGACHNKVAFPLDRCLRCHERPVR